MHRSSADIVLLVSLGAVTVGRLVLLSHYFWLVWSKASGTHRMRALRSACRATTVQLYPDGPPAELQERHSELVAAAGRQLDTSLVVGSLALASWTALFAAAASKPASSLTTLTRILLLTSSIVLIAGPALFRAGGGYLTALGREASTYIGYAALLLALASILADEFQTQGILIAIAMAIVIAARDVIEVRSIAKLQRYIDTASL
jgi:hypothetical protein